MATFTITRTFDAPRPLVFECWTNADHMARWYSPAGFKSELIHSDIRPGGYSHICLTAPDGMKLYGKYTYQEISPVERIVFVNAFADAEGNLARHPMITTWPLELLTTVTLKEVGAVTELTLTWIPINATAEEEAVFAEHLDSCKMGWTGTFDNLDGFLKTM